MTAGEKPSRAERDAQDAAAMARILAGDDSASRELYDRHAPFVFGVALKIVRAHEEAEDVVHDAFVAIVEQADQFRPDRGSVAAWLVTTVRNLALDRARRRTRRAQITDEELRHERPIPMLDPESLSWIEHRRTAVVAAPRPRPRGAASHARDRLLRGALVPRDRRARRRPARHRQVARGARPRGPPRRAGGALDIGGSWAPGAFRRARRLSRHTRGLVSSLIASSLHARRASSWRSSACAMAPRVVAPLPFAPAHRRAARLHRSARSLAAMWRDGARLTDVGQLRDEGGVNLPQFR